MDALLNTGAPFINPGPILLWLFHGLLSISFHDVDWLQWISRNMSAILSFLKASSFHFLDFSLLGLEGGLCKSQAKYFTHTKRLVTDLPNLGASVTGRVCESEVMSSIDGLAYCTSRAFFFSHHRRLWWSTGQAITAARYLSACSFLNSVKLGFDNIADNWPLPWGPTRLVYCCVDLLWTFLSFWS